jgi:hypothetical protein
MEELLSKNTLEMLIGHRLKNWQIISTYRFWQIEIAKATKTEKSKLQTQNLVDL